MKKIPLRTCVVTREQLPKMQLLRIVKDNEGHGFANEENRFEFYGAMETFLAKHLKP